MNATIWRLDAAGAADGVGLSMAPASALIQSHPVPRVSAVCGGHPCSPSFQCTLLALAHPGEIDRLPADAEVPPERRLKLPASVLLPALVNAHAHLDLTHIGPRPYDPSGGFVCWAMSTVRANRATTPEAAIASLRQGIALSLAGGVVAVADIVGVPPPIPGHPPRSPSEADIRVTLSAELRRAFGPMGIGFAEVFGMGPTRHRAIEHLTQLAAEGCSLQPHAPYTASREVYAHAASLCRGASEADRSATNPTPRLCTHLAETLDERRFIENGDGPFRDLLERIGVWDDTAATEVGHGLHPIEHVLAAIHKPAVSAISPAPRDHPQRTRSASEGHRESHFNSNSPPASPPLLAAHVNDCPQHLIPQLKSHNVSVAYCPRARAYFHHPQATGPHRYREMLEANVNVCLGTDSIINLPQHEADRLTPLDDARLLFNRDKLSATQLIALITTNAARALGLDESHFTLRNGPLAGLIAIDITGTSEHATPEDRALQSHAAPKLFQWNAASPAAGRHA
jgi:cytosine/adenosine deaminase-related metal-dependent hydrolase